MKVIKCVLLGLMAMPVVGCASLFVDDSAARFKVKSAEIRRIMESNMPEFKKCYAKSPVRNRDFKGNVVLNWQIDDRGQISSAEVGSSSMNNAEVEQCVLAHLEKIKFPALQYGEKMNLSYEIIFTTKTYWKVTRNY